MSPTIRAWTAAASIGAVEALKDQGFGRWNYAFRSIQQHVKNKNLGPYDQLRRLNPYLESSSKGGEEKMKQSEESLRKIMYLSCWGPN